MVAKIQAKVVRNPPNKVLGKCQVEKER